MVLRPGYGKLWKVSVAQNFDRIHWIFFYYVPFKVRNNRLFKNFFYTLSSFCFHHFSHGISRIINTFVLLTYIYVCRTIDGVVLKMNILFRVWSN